MGNITFFVIFAVLDVSLAVNLCINCSFFTFILLKVREVSLKKSGKSGPKLFIVSCIFASMQIFTRRLFSVKY